MMHDLTNVIMTGEGKAEISTVRQNLQLEYVDRLLNIVKSRVHQPTAQSVALYELQGIEKSLSKLDAAAPEANKAHFAYVSFKIKKGLDVKNG
jgi:hypothetical protein